jgi:NADPH-dependent 2,4-dienoyl-CoA reductase/sulfur reductase-like enzyme
MAGDEAKLTGPDLEAGIPEGELGPDASRLGHARGEPVLLVRRGDEIFALGATCTHYGGPLGEGLVVGETVRCPWHHACFDLRTGAPVRAPALNESPPVDRPNLSKDYLAGTAPEDWIPLRPPAFFGEQKIALSLSSRVASIDPAGKKLSLEDGREVGWDALLLATGADPVRPPIPGVDQTHVHTLRTFGDCKAIIDRASRARHAVVVGASFIGMEVAASLRARGIDVHVVAPEAVPFEKTLGPQLGALLRSVHEERGVKFHLGETVASIAPDSVTLSGGDRIGVDLVVIGVGVRPAIALAKSAGLEVDRGVIVDDRLRTSAASVFAAGDIARYPYGPTGERVRIEHWAVAQRMGRVAALNILGGDLPFTAPPFFWTTQYDVTLSYVGHAESWDQIDVAGDLDKRDATIAYRRGGKTLAVVTIGRDRTSLEAEVALESGDEKTLATFGRSR